MFELVDTRRENTKTFDTRAEAEEKKNDMVSLGAKPEDLEISKVSSDGGEGLEPGTKVSGTAEVVDHTEEEPITHDNVDTPEEARTEAAKMLPDDPPVDEDPVDWLPGHFVDTIQGVPTVNRKGYAVIASKYGVSVTSTPITLPSETDFEYAEFKAVAITEDGKEYSGYGSANINRQDGDSAHLLGELAETRAMKRATAWATGIGMTAASEMMGEL